MIYQFTNITLQPIHKMETHLKPGSVLKTTLRWSMKNWLIAIYSDNNVIDNLKKPQHIKTDICGGEMENVQ